MEPTLEVSRTPSSQAIMSEAARTTSAQAMADDSAAATASRSLSATALVSPTESLYSIVYLTDSPSIRSDQLFSTGTPVGSFREGGSAFSPAAPGVRGGGAGGGGLTPLAPGRAKGRPLPFPSPMAGYAINAEAMLTQARAIDADVQEVQQMLMRVSTAFEEARGLADRTELEAAAQDIKRDLDAVTTLVKKNIKGQVTAMQQETAASLKVPGCGPGSPSFHMRQTLGNTVKNKLRRRRDNALDLESRLNMGIRDTAKRRNADVIGSTPSDDVIDRLCSPAPPECKIGTLTRREPHLDGKMTTLLKEMEIRTNLSIETSKKLSALERELTFVIDILEHEESALEYEMAVEKKNRRSMAMWICLAFLVFLFVVFVIPGLAVYLP